MVERARGIDVSYHQGPIDWGQVAASGIAFAFIRASRRGSLGGNVRDARFESNWRAARAAGLMLGAYHYFIPSPGSLTQIDVFLRTLEGCILDLPPALDFEERPKGQSLIQRQENISAALQRVQQVIGMRPLIYTSSGWWNANLGRHTVWGGYPLWIANWRSLTSKPILPRDWSQWTFWQHTSSGKVAGIRGRVDLDVYNGTLEQLKEYVTRG